MLINFGTQEDLNKVMDGGPWMIEGEAILMQRWEIGMTGDDFVNAKINIWIHIHGLPYELRRSEIAVGFAKYAGEVVKPINRKKEASYEREFMSFRIALDTNKPILPGLFLS